MLFEIVSFGSEQTSVLPSPYMSYQLVRIIRDGNMDLFEATEEEAKTIKEYFDSGVLSYNEGQGHYQINHTLYTKTDGRDRAIADIAWCRMAKTIPFFGCEGFFNGDHFNRLTEVTEDYMIQSKPILKMFKVVPDKVQA